MKHVIWSLLAVAALSAAPGKQTFTGIITDDMCGKAGHSQMRMGPTDAGVRHARGPRSSKGSRCAGSVGIG